MTIRRLDIPEEEYIRIQRAETKIRELEHRLANEDLTFEQQVWIEQEINNLYNEIERR